MRWTLNATVVQAICAVALAISSFGTLWLLNLQLSEMHLDQRAWVGIGRVNSFDFKVGPNFAVPFDVANTGKTPALHVKTKASLKTLEKGQGFAATYTDPQSYKPSIGVVQPQMHITLSTLPTDVSAAQYGDIQNGRGILYAYGDIKYDDIYGNPHETTFCVMYYAGLSGPSPCDVYNEAN